MQIIKSFKNDVFGYYIVNNIRKYTTTSEVIDFRSNAEYNNFGILNRKTLVFHFFGDKKKYNCKVFDTFKLLKSKLDSETRLLQEKYNQSRKGNKF